MIFRDGFKSLGAPTVPRWYGSKKLKQLLVLEPLSGCYAINAAMINKLFSLNPR